MMMWITRARVVVLQWKKLIWLIFFIASIHPSFIDLYIDRHINMQTLIEMQTVD